ncbi:MAG: cytochrome C oxidase subunit IV family protein [Candidatus Omnitrophica bacterium]|nr:cytochrome C oxidase subunit IV family protein [Candidatus Omnitrophota bacterium]
MTNAQTASKTYLWIWAWLAGLMLLSVVASELPLAPRLITVIILGFSTVKALLVALYYMHLKQDRKTLSFVAVFPLLVVLAAVLLVASSRLVKL